MHVTAATLGRFFLDQPLTLGPAELADGEAHHLLHVLRAKPGDRIELFNGRGGEAIAEVASGRKRTAELRILKSWSVAPDAETLTLAVALPKGDRAKWLVEKLTELGVSRLIPLITERSVVEPSESKLAKFQQTVVAACKQSGRSHLMELGEATDFRDVVNGSTSPLGQSAATVRFLAHPASETNLRMAMDALPKNHAQALLILIGPEGGFTDAEVVAAKFAGIPVVGLGPGILRVETAALLVTSAWRLR